MRFTGRNLVMVRDALELAVFDVQNQIVTCPDFKAYAEEVRRLEAVKARAERLLDRINRAIKKEKSCPRSN